MGNSYQMAPGGAAATAAAAAPSARCPWCHGSNAPDTITAPAAGSGARASVRPEAGAATASPLAEVLAEMTERVKMRVVGSYVSGRRCDSD